MVRDIYHVVVMFLKVLFRFLCCPDVIALNVNIVKFAIKRRMLRLLALCSSHARSAVKLWCFFSGSFWSVHFISTKITKVCEPRCMWYILQKGCTRFAQDHIVFDLIVFFFFWCVKHTWLLYWRQDVPEFKGGAYFLTSQ